VIVYVYPADVYGCGAYRLIWPALALKAQGHDVRVVLPSMREGIGGSIDSKTGKLLDAQYPGDADVIVLQRVSYAHMSQAVAMMRAKGVAVVVDMDDDLTKIDPSNPAFGPLQVGGFGLVKHHDYRNAHLACLDATLVTVSTPALLKVYAPHGRGLVLENRVPARYLDIAHTDSAVVGWPGSVHSHPDDLRTLGPSVQRLVREGVEYLGIGPDFDREPGDGGLRRALGLVEDPRCSGSVGIDDWATALSYLGVGLAPLADTQFNAAKSWLKPLELMAVGVPFVASPRAEYSKVARHAFGESVTRTVLAQTPKDWYRKVKMLVERPALRRELSTFGREFVRAHMTIEANAWRWLEAWSYARDQQNRSNVKAARV
jgi:hypothetical protein